MATPFERIAPIICETFDVTDQEIGQGKRMAELANVNDPAWSALLFALEQAFGIDMNEDEFFTNCGTLGDIADLVGSKLIAREAA